MTKSKAALRVEALEVIERCGYTTQGDLYAVMGGDCRALEDPLVKCMLTILAEMEESETLK